MAILKLKFNLKSTDPLALLRLVMLGAITLVIGGLCFFLYRDFYQTIVQAEAVLVLKKEVALQDVELDLFRKVQSWHSYKQTSLLPESLSDPFASTKAIAPPLEAVATTTPTTVDNQLLP